MNDSNKPNRKRFDVFPILSLVLGLLGIIVIILQLKGLLILHFYWEFFLVPVCCLIGLICGITGLMKSTRKTLAKWGIATCIICILILLVISYAMLSFWAN
jgi:hypothetical protein